MTTPAQPVTLEQLARLFEAANKANSELSAARCAEATQPLSDRAPAPAIART